MKKTVVTLFVTTIVVLGVVLRFGPVMEERDYWYDEAFTGILVKDSWSNMNQMIFDDVHPPLYYWLTKLWAANFDYSSAGIRSFSLLMGVLTIVSAYWIGKKMFNERAGLLAALITTVSPFAIQYSQEARMYSLFGFLMIWSFYFFYKALKKNQTKDWIYWGIFGGLAFYTHYLSLFFFIIFYLAAVFYDFKFNKASFAKAILLTKRFWIGTGTIFLFFLSWMPWFIPHMMKGNLGWIGVSYLSDIPKTLQIFFFGHPLGAGGVPSANSFRYFFDGSSAGLLILILIIVALTIFWKKKNKSEEFFLLAVLSIGTLFFLILLSHFNLKLYVSRYFMPAAVMLYILTAGMITTIFKQASSWLWLFLIYLLMIISLQPVTYTSKWYKANLFLENNLDEKSYVVVTSPFDYTTMRYYLGVNKLKYYHKSNPAEDFSGWVVVGNENRLQTIEEIKNLENYVVIDTDCNWGDTSFKEIYKIDDLSICE